MNLRRNERVMTVPPPTRTARRITQTVVGRAESAEARAAELEMALAELWNAVHPQLGTMNFYFGPDAGTAISPEIARTFQRIDAACVRGREVLNSATSDGGIDDGTA